MPKRASSRLYHSDIPISGPTEHVTRTLSTCICCSQMNGVVLVSGDFVRTGGMDMANFALAQYLANCGERVELVAYRIADELAKHSNVRWRKVPKPLRSYLLGAPLLDRSGRQAARRGLAAGARVIV